MKMTRDELATVFEAMAIARRHDVELAVNVGEVVEMLGLAAAYLRESKMSVEAAADMMVAEWGGKKIHAIKALRDMPDTRQPNGKALGLKEAKEAVEAAMTRAGVKTEAL